MCAGEGLGRGQGPKADHYNCKTLIGPIPTTLNPKGPVPTTLNPKGLVPTTLNPKGPRAGPYNSKP